jgi:hypothetical protein
LPLRVLSILGLPRALGCMAPLRRFIDRRSDRFSALRFLPENLPAPLTARDDPLAGLNSPSEFYQYVADRGSVRASPLGPSGSFRGLVPYSVLPTAVSHIPPRASHLRGYVAPSGFRTLSTPCSHHRLPGLFHPGSTLGVRPSRPCSTPVPHALSSAASLMMFTRVSLLGFTFRELHTGGSPASERGV